MEIIEIECLKFESSPRGSFIGVCDFFIPGMQLEIYNCSLWMKNGKKWVNLPQRSFLNNNQKRQFQPYCRFTKPETIRTFTELCLKAIDKYCKENEKVDNPF